MTEDEFIFLEMAVEYWQDKEELINPSIDYVVDPTELLERLSTLIKPPSSSTPCLHSRQPTSTT